MKRYAILVILSCAVFAQDKPNFTGNWLLDHTKSDFGDFPSPDTQTSVIDHKGTDIKLVQTVKGDAVVGGEASTERRYTTDGKETVNRIGESNAKSVARWDGRKLIIETKLETPNGTVVIADSWELADSGKELVVAREIRGPDTSQRQRFIYNRQSFCVSALLWLSFAAQGGMMEVKLGQLAKQTRLLSRLKISASA
jgi:hypothetical protein